MERQRALELIPPAAGWRPVLAVASALAFYVVLVLSFGTNMAPMSGLPIVAAALAYGARGGVMVGMGMFPVNFALIVAYGEMARLLDSGRIFGTVIGSAVGVAVGAAVGKYRDMVLQRDRTLQALDEARARLVKTELERHTALHRARLASAERLASIGALAAGVAHELNTPLGYVTSNVNFVRQALQGGVPSDGARRELFDVLEETEQGLERIRHVVSGFAEFASPAAVAEGPQDVRDVVRGVLVMIETWLVGRARLELDLGAVPLVRGSTSRLRELLALLLMYAAESVARDGGPAPAIHLRTATAAEGRLRVEVAHSGPALSPTEREAMFNPSSGLAMWICRGIAEELGGGVSVECGAPRGVTLIVDLPPDPSPPG